MTKRAIKFILVVLLNFVFNISIGQAQEFPPMKDPRALCLEMRKQIESWKASTIQAQNEHRFLMQNRFREPLTVERRNASAYYVDISYTFTRKLISDHFGLCVQGRGFDTEIPPVPAISLGN